MKLRERQHEWLQAIEEGDHVRAINAIHWETIRGTRINAMGMSLLYRIAPIYTASDELELVKSYRRGVVCRALFHEQLFELVKPVHVLIPPPSKHQTRIQDARHVAYYAAWLATCDSFKGAQRKMHDAYNHLSYIAALDQLTEWFPEMDLLLKHFSVRDVR